MKRIRNISLVVYAVMHIVFVNAQEQPAYGPPVAPVYKAKVQHFKTLPVKENDIVFLGNSITAGVDWAELLNDTKIKNRGIGGDNTFGLLERLSDITQGKPSKLFIMIGTNDLSAKIPADIILKNYETIISRIKKETPGTEIFVQAVLPINNTILKNKRTDKVAQILVVNSALKKLAKKMEVTFIDLYPYFSDGDNALIAGYTYDGLHLNINGYLLWRKILIEKNFFK